MIRCYVGDATENNFAEAIDKRGVVGVYWSAMVWRLQSQ